MQVSRIQTNSGSKFESPTNLWWNSRLRSASLFMFYKREYESGFLFKSDYDSSIMYKSVRCGMRIYMTKFPFNREKQWTISCLYCRRLIREFLYFGNESNFQIEQKSNVFYHFSAGIDAFFFHIESKKGRKKGLEKKGVPPIFPSRMSLSDHINT